MCSGGSKLQAVPPGGLRQSAYMCSVGSMNSAEQAVAAEVRAALARHKIEQSKVAEALGISQSSVSHRINGHRPFSVAELVIVAGLVDGRPEEFLRTIPAPSLVA